MSASTVIQTSFMYLWNDPCLSFAIYLLQVHKPITNLTYESLVFVKSLLKQRTLYVTRKVVYSIESASNHPKCHGATFKNIYPLQNIDGCCSVEASPQHVSEKGCNEHHPGITLVSLCLHGCKNVQIQRLTLSLPHLLAVSDINLYPTIFLMVMKGLSSHRPQTFT